MKDFYLNVFTHPFHLLSLFTAAPCGFTECNWSNSMVTASWTPSPQFPSMHLFSCCAVFTDWLLPTPPQKKLNKYCLLFVWVGLFSSCGSVRFLVTSCGYRMLTLQRVSALACRCSIVRCKFVSGGEAALQLSAAMTSCSSISLPLYWTEKHFGACYHCFLSKSSGGRSLSTDVASQLVRPGWVEQHQFDDRKWICGDTASGLKQNQIQFPFWVCEVALAGTSPLPSGSDCRQQSSAAQCQGHVWSWHGFHPRRRRRRRRNHVNQESGLWLVSLSVIGSSVWHHPQADRPRPQRPHLKFILQIFYLWLFDCMCVCSCACYILRAKILILLAKWGHLDGPHLRELFEG